MSSVAIMQPTFLPWLGYLDLMDQVDTFVVYDDAQFSYQSWQHRNRIRTRSGLAWLTVPIARTSRFEPLHAVKIAEGGSFPDRMRNQFEESYRHAPFEQLGREVLEPALSAAAGDGLVELNLAILTIL